MKCCRESQADQSEILDNCYYVISVLKTLCSKGHIIIQGFHKFVYYFAICFGYYTLKKFYIDKLVDEAI